jgi:hypothetical protein
MDVIKKREMLNTYLRKHHLKNEIAERIDINSFHTDNFVYKAMRIGNNIGDPYEIAIDIVFLETIAEEYSLKLDLTDYPELQTKDISETELDKLVSAAKIFESRKDENTKEFDKISLSIKQKMQDDLKALIRKG